jgi:Cu/Ag efflux protein CusF
MLKIKTIYLSLLFLLAFAACEKPQTTPKPPSVATTVSPTVVPSNATNSKIKTYNGKGIVTKIDLKLVSVELDHEEIKDLMPAMRMEFYVKEKSELEILKLGDTVEFVLEDNAGAEKIISIKKIQ